MNHTLTAALDLEEEKKEIFFISNVEPDLKKYFKIKESEITATKIYL